MLCVCFGAPCRKDVHIPDLYIDDSPYHSAVTHDMIYGAVFGVSAAGNTLSCGIFYYRKGR